MSTNPVAEFFDPRTLADPYAYYQSRRTAFRGVLGKLLRDKRFHKMRPQIRAVAASLVDDFAPVGRCEFTRD